VSVNDFFTKGLHDAEQRVSLLRPIRPEEQQALLTILRSSQVFRFIDLVVDRVTRAGDTSMVVQSVRQLWSGTASAQKRLVGGIGLLVAASVHVGLVTWHEQPPSWLWLIVPGLAVAAGLLLLAFAGTEGKEHV
jgi:hypothetical protein